VLVGALALAGVVVYTSRVFDPTSSRAASTDRVKVYQGSGYSFEVPVSWDERSVAGTAYDFGFTLPQTNTAAVVSGTRVPGAANLTDPEVQSFVFDTVARGLQLDLKGLPVTSKTTVTVHGAPGQQIVLSGIGGDSQPTRVRQTAFVHGESIFVVAMVGHGSLADDPTLVTDYQQVLDSFRFS
jgi:hypothetical protein